MPTSLNKSIVRDSNLQACL